MLYICAYLEKLQMTYLIKYNSMFILFYTLEYQKIFMNNKNRKKLTEKIFSSIQILSDYLLLYWKKI